MATLGAFLARVLLCGFTFTVPDAVRIVLGEEIPGASFILETKLPRAVLAVLVGLALACPVRSSRARCATRWPRPTSSVSPWVPVRGPRSRSASSVRKATASRSGPPGAPWRWPPSCVPSAGSGNRLILVGVGATVALQALVQYFLTRADEYDAHIALWWLTGSVGEATWSQIRLVAVGLLILLPLTALLVKSLGIAELGPDFATGLGVGPRRTDLVLLMAVLLVAVAVAGPVAFVAFLSGPIARAPT